MSEGLKDAYKLVCEQRDALANSLGAAKIEIETLKFRLEAERNINEKLNKEIAGYLDRLQEAHGNLEAAVKHINELEQKIEDCETNHDVSWK